MLRHSFLVLFVFAFFTACQTGPQFDINLLYGEWEGADWLVKGKTSGRDARDVRFTFGPDGTYTASYGEQKESGAYRVDGLKLYTTAADKIEKVVRIERISSDTLALGMNRVGQDEQLILVKQ